MTVSVIQLALPTSKQILTTLEVGQELRLSGDIYTMRDAGHIRCLDLLEQAGQLPFNLAGQALFYAGPTPALASQPFGAIGPTTAARMDVAAVRLYRAGIQATLGKGRRSAAVEQACRECLSVYLVTVGGAAALLARHVVSSELVAWPDLGSEALYRLKLQDFPAWVAIDTTGRQL
ncbi:MAG: FumA C-terminus/TtdB family hydratase beta subunit [Coriobacteriales bacterium]|jgi:fumarate hydratase class I/fumarate hydratase subunit beta|nr:FumA C-terminus/TtdB family hydratase beta subunit [Coriobacteriales bacterium]